MDTYTAVAEFAQSWGLIYFIVVFCVVVGFVLWPSRKKSFDDASFIPLREDKE